MCPLTTYPVLEAVLKPFRRSQQKTLALFITAIAEVAEARSLALAAHLARRLQIQVGSALRRFYRLLDNPHIEDQLLTLELLELLSPQEHQEQHQLLLAVDWTRWSDEMQMLLASAVVGRRAIPVQSFAGCPAEMDDSQNHWEVAFTDRLLTTLDEGGHAEEAVLIFDRGFHRADFLAHLQAHEASFIVRLPRHVSVTPEGAARQRLSALPLCPGSAVDLGRVWLRTDRRVAVRVVGVWAKGQKEPWWLATSLEEVPLSVLASLYDRRMGIEEQLRDTKGCRFGLRLQWTQFHTPRYLQRFMLLLGVALLLWTAAGAATLGRRPKAQMPCKKGPRLSIVRVGIYFLKEVAERSRLTLRFIQHHLPSPTLRSFAWLDAPP